MKDVATIMSFECFDLRLPSWIWGREGREGRKGREGKGDEERGRERSNPQAKILATALWRRGGNRTGGRKGPKCIYETVKWPEMLGLGLAVQGLRFIEQDLSLLSRCVIFFNFVCKFSAEDNKPLYSYAPK